MKAHERVQEELFEFVFNDVLSTWKKRLGKSPRELSDNLEEELSDLERAVRREHKKKTIDQVKKQSKQEITSSIEELLESKQFTKHSDKDEIEWYIKQEIEKPVNTGYTLQVQYTDNGEREEFALTVIPDQYAVLGEESEEKPYTETFTRIKEPGEISRSISITYTRTEIHESVHIQYHQSPNEYMTTHIERRENFSESTMHMKHLNVLSSTTMPGVYGFTYLGSNFMARRDDLVGDFAHRVDTHEAIHTPDEYETRRIEDWHFEPVQMKYKLPQLKQLSKL